MGYVAKIQINFEMATILVPFFTYIYFNTIHLKYTHVAKLPDLVGIQHLSACAFVEVVFEGDAASPVLDLVAARPKADVNGFEKVKDFS